MRRVRRIFWLGLKEIAALARDRALLGLLVYSFSLGLMMEATGAPETVNNASIAFVDEDRSPLSRRLADAFYPPRFQPAETIPAAEAGPAMDAGRYLFVVSVPPGFEADVRAGRAPALSVAIDATAMEQAGIGSGYVTAILADEIRRHVERRDEGGAAGVALVVHHAFNPNADAGRFVAVVSLVNNVTMLTVILTGAAMIREREHGTIEHLLAMPLGPLDIALAKIWANGAVVLVAAGLSLALVVEGALGLPPAGSRWLFLAGTAVYLFSATALGVFLATVARSMAQFALLVILTILPLQLLSGGDTPVESQPDWLQPVTALLPTRHFVAFAQGVLFRGADLATLWPSLAAIAALGAACLVGSLLAFRRSIATDR